MHLLFGTFPFPHYSAESFIIVFLPYVLLWLAVWIGNRTFNPVFNLCFGHTIPSAHKYMLFKHEHGISKHVYNISGNNKTCHGIQTAVYITCIPRSRCEQTTCQKCHKIVKNVKIVEFHYYIWNRHEKCI